MKEEKLHLEKHKLLLPIVYRGQHIILSSHTHTHTFLWVLWGYKENLLKTLLKISWGKNLFQYILYATGPRGYYFSEHFRNRNLKEAFWMPREIMSCSYTLIDTVVTLKKNEMNSVRLRIPSTE